VQIMQRLRFLDQGHFPALCKLVLLVLTIMPIGCGDSESFVFTNTPNQPPPNAVTFSNLTAAPNPIALLPGATRQLTVTATASTGQVVDVTSRSLYSVDTTAAANDPDISVSDSGLVAVAATATPGDTATVAIVWVPVLADDGEPVLPGAGLPTPLTTSVQVTVTTPGGGGEVAELNEAGLDALAGGEFTNYVTARNFFAQAVGEIDGDTPQNDADTARFFYALTRVAAIAAELEGPNPALQAVRPQNTSFQTVGDFLDALGYPESPRTSYTGLEVPATFSTGVTAEDGRDFLVGPVRSELLAAIAGLGQVSQSFNVVWVRAQNAPGLGTPNVDVTVESDYGDVLSFRSSFRTLLGFVLVVGANDLGSADVGATLNDAAHTVQSILAGSPTAFTLEDGSLLGQAQTQFDAAIDDGIDAANFIEAETDPQNNDLISLASIPEMTVEEYIAEALVWQDALFASTTLSNAAGDETASLNLQNYFNGSDSDLRDYLPPFTDNAVSGLFPGVPFGTLYNNYTSDGSMDPNRDVDGNNVPDMLEPLLRR
jgi:hypothetical protein